MSYLYSDGATVFFYDEDNDSIKKLKIRHRMSGWSRDDWEYYNCVGEDYDEDGDDIWEVSQHDLFPTYQEANGRAISMLQKKIKRSIRASNRLKMALEHRKGE